MRELLAVANSSPLIALERIGQLDLLPILVGRLRIPSSVRREVFGSKPLPDWVEEVALQQPLAPRMVGVRLGPGEREAIVLALELGAAELIVDDLPARRLAISLGLSVVGTLGLLLQAKQRGLITALRPLMENLQGQDFRISEKLSAGMLVAAGKSDSRAGVGSDGD